MPTTMPDAMEGHALEPRLEQSWRSNAQAWSRAVREGRIASRRAGTDAAIIDAVLHTNARRVLDLGCGEGWRIEAFDAFGGNFREPMPWYFRALQAWLDAKRASGFVIDDIAEPSIPSTADHCRCCFARLYGLRQQQRTNMRHCSERRRKR